MARKLPWKRTSEPYPSDIRRKPAAQSPGARFSASSSTAQDDSRDVLRTPVSRRYAQRVLDSDPIRSPSTSPPPERPHEQFMNPGPLNDDKYRMVDDEFLHIAQRFTAHLHRAEYDRLKTLAKAQNAATIREIERPVVVDAAPTARARQRSDLAQRDVKQRKTLEGGGEARDEESVPSLARTNLRGLMEAPRREGRIIMPSASASSSSSRTRAAAGYSSKSSPQGDRRSRARSPPASMPASSKRIKFDQPSHSRPATTSSRNVVPNPHISNQAASSSATETDRKEISHSGRNNHNRQPTAHSLDDELDDDLFGLHERRMNRKKLREQSKRPDVKRENKEESRTIDFGSIPSFF
ncbi:uncharacterized protein TrAtP1_001643 [Trichoderma atroviride]|uniref:Uncharacterized protein n=1 Tax=Hypocrea atroviridis (strain ATCC 20476 / IMI 206040) TaxID=452589 RepID=G9P0H3_HYPAI|nr:uncharacterized protein TRIATDRAFT_285805 [Trichoderma atroviride IMI 206040]EHK43163.1 hypothetical protein TRIATDRAFT_285805 [Trichoderma atroviride IMI 206040]UKZ60362.1 hypothetical protein TrAtP1_001643 [Trichoderma atroviride]